MEDTTTIWLAPPGGINPSDLSDSIGRGEIGTVDLPLQLAMFDSHVGNYNNIKPSPSHHHT